jgi:ureidoacrylate peracid hydrolase
MGSPTRQITVDAQPEAMTLAPARTAVVLVDMQNDFGAEAGDILIHKNRYSAFYDTDLDAILEARSITTLVVAGWTTSVCVESTIRDAMLCNYTCLLLTDYTAEPLGRENYEARHLPPSLN